MALFREKRILITGGGSGLGKQIALTFAAEGAHVAILGLNLQQCKEAAGQIRSARKFEGQKVWFEVVDVSKKDEVDRVVKDLLDTWGGGIEVLVNCAGMTCDRLLVKMKEEEWDLILAANLKSVYNMSHALIRPMIKARSGKIINIASVVGFVGNPGQTNYAASKAGMIGFTRSLSKEVASRNITVNCIAPGFFDTPMTSRLTDEQKSKILCQIPMQRFGKPEELAEAVLFLASHDYITGQVLIIDGGMSA